MSFLEGACNDLNVVLYNTAKQEIENTLNSYTISNLIFNSFILILLFTK